MLATFNQQIRPWWNQSGIAPGSAFSMLRNVRFNRPWLAFLSEIFL